MRPLPGSPAPPRRPSRDRLLARGIAVAALAAACEDAPPPGVSPALPGAAAAAAAPAAPEAAAPEAMADKRPVLTEEDFLEGDQNRDPFRNFLSEFGTAAVIRPEGPDARVVLQSRFALDELKLIAVVSGGQAAPTAMFRNPQGVGQIVRIGDYLSKAAARISKILSDRVLLELDEYRGEDEPPKVVIREFTLHPQQEK